MNWLVSLIAGRWLALAGLVGILAVLVGIYGLGRHHSTMRWEARMAAQERAYTDAAHKAQQAADAAVARQKQATIDAARLFTEKQNENALLADRNRALADRLRSALARRADPVPAAPADPGGTEPAPGGQLSVPVEFVVSGLVDFAGACARSRDDIAAQVNALLDAWPR